MKNSLNTVRSPLPDLAPAIAVAPAVLYSIAPPLGEIALPLVAKDDKNNPSKDPDKRDEKTTPDPDPVRQPRYPSDPDRT
jgi:hypothetical protein